MNRKRTAPSASADDRNAHGRERFRCPYVALVGQDDA